MKNLKLAPRVLLSLVMLIGCAPQADKSKIVADTRTIVGGTLVPENSEISPSAVLIIIDMSPEKGVSICSGTLIAKNLVLTAAHCTFKDDNPATPFSAEQYHLLFGNVRVNFKEENSYKNYRAHVKAAKLVPHEEYMGSLRSEDLNDIALIKFDGDLPPGVKPAAILPLSLSDIPTISGTPVSVAGFGKTEKNENVIQINLKQADLTTSIDRGNSIYGLFGINQGICGGDSGGPSYVQIHGKRYLWAVNTMSNCASVTFAVNLADYQGWIRKKATELQTEGPDFGARSEQDAAYSRCKTQLAPYFDSEKISTAQLCMRKVEQLNPTQLESFDACWDKLKPYFWNEKEFSMKVCTESAAQINFSTDERFNSCWDKLNPYLWSDKTSAFRECTGEAK